MALFELSIEHDLDKVAKFAKRMDFILRHPPLRRSSRNIISTMVSVMDSGAFVPVSEATRRIRGAGKPLVVTGKLRKSIKIIRVKQEEVEIGSNLPQAGLLRFGGTTSGRSAIPGKRVPERDFLKVTEIMLNRVASDMLVRL